jgi:hypothetical protein
MDEKKLQFDVYDPEDAKQLLRHYPEWETAYIGSPGSGIGITVRRNPMYWIALDYGDDVTLRFQKGAIGGLLDTLAALMTFLEANPIDDPHAGLKERMKLWGGERVQIRTDGLTSQNNREGETPDAPWDVQPPETEAP